MAKVYYCGDLFELSEQYEIDVLDYEDGIKLRSGLDSYSTIVMNRLCDHMRINQKKRLKDRRELTTEELDVLNKVLKDKSISTDEDYLDYIIYEEILREDGEVFGREILTGLIFPIGYQKYRKIKSANIDGVISTSKYIIDVPGMAKADVCIFPNGVADYLDLEDYLESDNYDKSKIEKLYKQNVFSKEFIQKDTKEELQQELKTIYDIEFLLNSLKSTNEELYNKRREEFNVMLDFCNVDNANTYVGIEKLKSFETRVAFDLFFVKKDENSKAHIYTIITKYVNEQQRMTLDLLDYYCNVFFKYIKELNMKEANSISHEIALLYLYYVLNNDVDIERLKKSHFIDLLKLIVVASYELKNKGIIENSINLDIEDISIENVVSEINKIKTTYKKSLK